MTDAPLATGTCRGCSAPILWGRRASGKAQPLDREPNDAGNLVIECGLVAQYQPLIHNDGRPRYMPHHATCPNVADFREGSRK